MAVHLTRIYTRTGDAGTTALGDGSRVAKTDPRIEAYADVDETNAALGVVLALGAPEVPEAVVRVLTTVQNDLFDVGADLSTPIALADGSAPGGGEDRGESGGEERTGRRREPGSRLRVSEAYVTRLESWCDELNADLPALDSFILPGGTRAAALLHVARTICRRAERRAWSLVELDGQRVSLLAVTYLNRLSDLLFILARVCNPAGDVRWVPGAGA